MGISECVGTVKEVLRDLRKGKGLPTCSLVSSPFGGKAGSSFVSYRRAPLTPSCPDGTTQGQVGVLYHQGRKPDNLTRYSKITGGASTAKQVIYVGKSEHRFETGDYVSRACVGGQNYGQLTTGGYYEGRSYRNNDDSRYVPEQTHQWYEKVVVMTPDGADYEFDVTIDGKPHSRHRFGF